MTENTIPYVLDRIISLGQTAYTGALDVGAAVGLKQNDAPTLLGRLRAVIGTPPATPEGELLPGTVAIYDAAVSALTAANANHRTALSGARTYCREAIDHLRRYLGRQWNPAWSAAGFTGGSLAVPVNPEALLNGIRSYIGAHPEHGNASLSITVAGVQQKLDAIANTRRIAKMKLAERVEAKESRDDSIEALRQCLTGLRGELSQLIDADDERWYQFGFVRPADGHAPSPVKTLTLRQSLPGEVLANWTRTALAIGYRLSWRLNVPDATSVPVGLVSDRTAMISGLPSGQSVIVSVTARNSTGESAATEMTIVVP